MEPDRGWARGGQTYDFVATGCWTDLVIPWICNSSNAGARPIGELVTLIGAIDARPAWFKRPSPGMAALTAYGANIILCVRAGGNITFAALTFRVKRRHSDGDWHPGAHFFVPRDTPEMH